MSEADAMAAVDDERQEEGPALPDDELASWPGELADQERERRIAAK